MEKRLRLSDNDRMLLLLALADYAESRAEYHGLETKVWMLAERLTGASPGPAPQNVALWIREQTGTLNGPMDTHLPNGQVVNEEPSAGDQPAEKGRPEEDPVEAEQPDEPVAVSETDRSLPSVIEAEHSVLPVTAPRPPSRVEVQLAWESMRHRQRAEAERQKLWKKVRCAVQGCKRKIVARDEGTGWVCEQHCPTLHDPPEDWAPEIRDRL